MIVLKNVGYDSFYATILKNINLHVKSGEVVAVVGPNGSGKTSLLKLLTNQVEPTSGELFLLGKSHNDPDFKLALKFVTYLGNGFYLDLDETVLQHLKKFTSEHKLTEYYVFDLANRLQLRLFRKLNELSIGEQQRLNILKCFANPGKIIVLDNPTDNLDPFIKEVVYDLIREAQANNSAILLTSNDLYEVEKIANRLVFLIDGQIELDKTLEELKRPKERIVKVMNTDHIIILKDLVLEGYDETSYTYRYTGSMDKLLKYLSDFELFSFTIEEVSLYENIKRYCNRLAYK